MKTPNPEHVQRLITVINSAPYFQLLSMKIQNIGAGYCAAIVSARLLAGLNCLRIRLHETIIEASKHGLNPIDLGEIAFR